MGEAKRRSGSGVTYRDYKEGDTATEQQALYKKFQEDCLKKGYQYVVKSDKPISLKGLTYLLAKMGIHKPFEVMQFQAIGGATELAFKEIQEAYVVQGLIELTINGMWDKV